MAPRISWRAIFAGAVTSIALAGCLGLLGIGLGAIKVPAAGILTAVSVRAALWLIVTNGIAFYVGGWVGSRLAGIGRISDSVIHGLASWATAMVGLLLMLPAIGSVFGLALKSAPGTAVAFGWAAPGAVVAFGMTGFLMTAIDCLAACLGARQGARLLLPVPVDEYSKARKHEREPVSSAGF